MINKVVQTKGNSHLYGADESPSMRAVPLHLFFISLSLRFSFSVSVLTLSIIYYYIRFIPAYSRKFSHYISVIFSFFNVSITLKGASHEFFLAFFSLCFSLVMRFYYICKLWDETKLRPSFVTVQEAQTVPCSCTGPQSTAQHVTVMPL